MTSFRRAWHGATLVLLALALSGCFPSADSQVDEEKEPHFLRASNLAKSMDFKGAVEMYEEALKVNPNNSRAHYELAILHESQETVADPAVAIYHYQRFLRLNPRASNADVVKAHINGCKLEIAKSISALPLTPAVQRDYERTLAENRDLKTRLTQWMAYAASHAAPGVPPANLVVTNPAPATPYVAPGPARPAPVPVPGPVPIRSDASRIAVPPAGAPGGVGLTNRAAAPTPRTYVVKAGDIPSRIASKHGITMDALLAANPNLSAKHMQIGQTLTIPAR